jgi:tetratricopeptide (TPR) repeat protein
VELPWEIEARQLPGKSPVFAGAQTFRFRCTQKDDRVHITIPGRHFGPDTIDPTFPAQRAWMNTGVRTELLRPYWDCAWDTIDANAFEAFVALLRPHMTAKNAADQRTLDELRKSSGKSKRAIAEATQLLAASPDWGTVVLIRGKAREWGRDLEGAKVDYDRALELEPDNVEALLAAGYIRIADLASGEEALALFARAVALAPTDDRSRYHYTRQLQRLGRTEEALGELDRGAPFMAVPERAYLRAEWLHELGRDDEAQIVLKAAVKGPGGPRAQALLDAIRAQAKA